MNNIPTLLAGDAQYSAMAQLIEETFGEIDISSLLFYMVDIAPNNLLLHLADQFHVIGMEGWDFAESDNDRRVLLKNAIELHRYKGTKWAIRTVLTTLNMQGKVLEWFEYDGKPYRFKVAIDISKRGINEKDWERLVQLLLSYKNQRSRLESIDVTITNNCKQYYIAMASSGEVSTVIPKIVKNIDLMLPIFYKAGTWIFEKISVFPKQELFNE